MKMIFYLLHTFQGFIADAISEQIIDALNIFFEIDIGETTTVGDLLEDWLDVTFTGMMMNFLFWKTIILF